MPTLDNDTLQTLIGDIYDAVLDAEKWTPLLDRLGRVYNGSTLLYSQKPMESGARLHAGGNIDHAGRDAYENYYSKKRPWLEKLARVDVGEVVPISRWIDERTYLKTEYYNDCCAPKDLFYHLSAVLRRDDGVITTFVMARPHRIGDITAVDCALANRLVPHMQRALQMHHRLVAANIERQAFLQGLDGLGVGVVLAAGDGRLLFANRVAEAILRRGDGLGARSGRLHAATPALTAELCRHIHEAAHTGARCGQQAGGALSLPRQVGGELSILICPLPLDATLVIGPTVPTALIFVGAPRRNAVVRQSDLQRLYGLTAAEAKLVEALLAGISLGDYAQTRGISHATAKTQLRQVFLKTGQNRQSDVVRHLLSNPIVQLAEEPSSDGQ
jgi:DNA-binding CsgD family transcriptional regulator